MDPLFTARLRHAISGRLQGKLLSVQQDTGRAEGNFE